MAGSGSSSRLILALLCLGPLGCARAQTTLVTICPDLRYQLRGPDNIFCYQYYDIGEDYSAANRSCVRDGATLLYIDDASEDTYIYNNFYLPRGQAEFWIGLNDLNREGIFRWENSSLQNEPVYTNWTGGSPTVTNTNTLDCVVFSGSGWQVHQTQCAIAMLPHVCKMYSCSSADGRTCNGIPTQATSTNVVVIVVPIILVILVVLIGVVILLLCLWKCTRESLRRYLCCCVSGGPKNVIHSMQQENQRLRHELSQHKVSMSGRFQPGQLNLNEERELSGVPDGKGGVLPTIKQPITPGNQIPAFPASGQRRFTLTSMDDQNSALPPPLVAQQPSSTGMIRQTSQTSNILAPTRPLRQSLPVIVKPVLPVKNPNQPTTNTLTTKLDEISESDSSDSEHDQVSPGKN